MNLNVYKVRYLLTYFVYLYVLERVKKIVMKKLSLLFLSFMLIACSSADVPSGGRGGIIEPEVEVGPLIDENGVPLVKVDTTIMNSYTIMVGSLDSNEYEIVEDEDGNICRMYDFKLEVSYAGDAFGTVQISVPYSKKVELDVGVVPDLDMRIVSLEELGETDVYEIVNPLFKDLEMETKYMIFVKNETSDPFELKDNVSIFAMLDEKMELWVNGDMNFETDYSEWQKAQFELEETQAYSQDQIDRVIDEISGKKIGDVIQRFSQIIR